MTEHPIHPITTPAPPSPDAPAPPNPSAPAPHPSEESISALSAPSKGQKLTPRGGGDAGGGAGGVTGGDAGGGAGGGGGGARSGEAEGGAGGTREGSGASGGEASESPGDAELAEARSTHTLEQQLEALLIVADEPLSAVTLATACDRPVRETRAALAALVASYDGTDGSIGATPRGFELREIAGGYRFYVRESLDPVVADFVHQQSPAKLSQAALETLAVIAYRQPVSRGAIASIRAVNVDSVVRTLLGRGLITEAGHDSETGATLYGTSEALLGHLGIGDIGELPPVAPLLEDGSEGFDHESL